LFIPIVFKFKRGKVEKCDLYGNSVLHFAVRSRNSNSVSFLINYQPSLIWIMDLNNFTAKELAELLQYEEIHEILECFSNEFKKKFSTLDMFKIYMKETKRAQKRRRKYEKQMKRSEKLSLKEYKAKKLYKFEYGCKIYSAYNQIVFDENIVFAEKYQIN
jgi:GTPase involved in cell partitioning and DNA repair